MICKTKKSICSKNVEYLKYLKFIFYHFMILLLKVTCFNVEYLAYNMAYSSECS